MRDSKVVSACIFNKLQAVGLFLAFDGASTRTDHFTSGKKYRKLVNNGVFIRNKSLFFVSDPYCVGGERGAYPAHCPGGYRIRNRKILVMLVNGEYYGSRHWTWITNKESGCIIDAFTIAILTCDGILMRCK